ncbi:MAG TPA: PAS domain-containing protein [Actinomycetota bacterium]|nr:PAS domain-containing protein [Actinomycetota bacterium]
MSGVCVLTYRHLVEGIPAVLYVDANDDLSSNLYTSPQIEALLGFTVEQWRDDPALWVDRIHEDDRERVLEEHRESLRTGEPFRTEYRLLAADGREVWIRDEAVLVRGAAHEPPFWRGVMTDVTRTKRVEGRLRRSLEVLRRTMEDRRQLLVRLDDARVEERRRIASDLHDDPIQVMSAADIRAQALAHQIDDPELRQEAEELRDVIRSSVERLRHLLFELRPPALDREGLVPALRAYLGDEDPTPEIEDDLPFEPPSELRAILFRIAQEAIANARKHACATRIRVSIAAREGSVRLVITDDGLGFDVGVIESPEPGHIGLPTMIERAQLAGGGCVVQSEPRRGTTVSAWLPLAEPSSAKTG